MDKDVKTDFTRGYTDNKHMRFSRGHKSFLNMGYTHFFPECIMWKRVGVKVS